MYCCIGKIMSKLEEQQTFYSEDSDIENEESHDSLAEESEISEEEASIQDKKIDFYDSIVIEDTKKEYKKDIPTKSNEDLDTYFSDEYSENVTSPDFLPIDKKMYYASRSFIRHEGPVAAHINSYNYAVCYLIPSIVESKGTVSVTHDGLVHKISLSNFYSGKPKHKENNESIITVNPKLCLDRKISYVAPTYVDMTYYNPNGSTVTTTKKCIGEIPVMLMSTLCTLSSIKNDENTMAYLHEDVREVGGYFIVKGQQKVLIHQVKPSHNQICTYKGKNTPGTGPKFAMYAETRSGSTSSHTTTTRAGILAKNNLLAISIPYIELPIPLGVVFKALGAKSDRDIANYIFPEETYVLPPSLEYKDMINIIFKSLEQTFNCQTQDEALNYIGKNGQKFSKHPDREDEDDDEEEKKFKSDEKKMKDTLLAVSYTKHLLANEFLPHVGLGEEFNKTKCHFLGLMIQRALMTHVGLITTTDRDHFMNKRIHTSGMILATQFYNAFRKLMSRIAMSMEKNIKNSIPIIASSYITSPYIITSSLISALTCNKWSAKGKNKGVSQAIDNFNFCALLSCLRKFVIPLNTDAGKIEGPRHLHGSQWGVACMYKTPEGKQVGLVQGFAMGAYVSIGSDPEPIIEILKDLDICPMEEIQSSADYLKYTKVFVNGNPRGYTKYPQEITNQLRRLRRSAHIDMEASILYDEIEKSIYISTETGRVGRAVAIAPNGELKLTEKVLDEIKDGLWDTRESNAWVKLVERGYTELLFKDEEEEMNVAIYPSQLVKMNAYDRVKYTHTELTPDLIEGAGVSTSPHNDHNQAPRNIYQESMSHQSIGNTSNAAFLRKGKWFTLKYPQKPIVSTRISRELGFSDMPMGQNVTICAMPWGGRGQEDSVIFHEQALKRGLFATNAYIAYEATLSHPESSNTSRFEAFDIPNPQDCNDFNGDPRKLKFDEDYVYVPVGTEVSKDDILIGMVVSGSPENPMFAKHKNKINKSIRYEYKLPGVIHSVQKGFDDKGYKYIRLVVLQERIPVLGDKFCYSPDHQVLTTKGWVNIADVTLDHQVASLKDGKELVYEHPTHVTFFPLNKGEQLIHVDSNQVDLCVTGNHDMWVKTRCGKKFEKKKAEDLFDLHVHYKKDAEWLENDGFEYFELPKYTHRNSKHKQTVFPCRNLPIEPFLTFYGIWLAEGWTREKHSVGIAGNKQRVRDAYIPALEKMGFGYVHDSYDKINVYDKQLLNYMTFCESTGALNKTMGDWVWTLDKNHCRILLEGMLLGDGHMNGNTPMYDTSSVKLKDDVMRLALHCGWAANAKVRYESGRHHIIKGKDTVTHADSWRLTIIKTQLSPAVNKHTKNQQNWVDPTHQNVYCCTVPNGLLYVRNTTGEGQKPVWCGNSGVHGQKGTVGTIYPTNKMPYLKNRGYTADMLINPLAFPSRMTIGMLLEMIMGVAITSSALSTDEFDKPLCLDEELEGCESEMKKTWRYPEGFDPKNYEHLSGDASPWDKSFSIDTFYDALKRIGMDQYSEEIAVNPETGEELKYPVFSSVVFYQRLKHMSVDKIHARARGNRHGFHKQPTEGRKKGGGFRFGHMERDFLIPTAPVALREGISVMIKDLAKFEKVWGYNHEKEGLVTSNQVNFGTGENRPHYVMTLQDGRTIEGSNNHPFYTETGEYSDMKYLKVGQDRLACTINPPLVDLEEEIKLCEGWSWMSMDMKYFKLFRDDEIDKLETFRRSLCLARLLGLATSDGFVSVEDDIVRVFPDHQFDVETVLADIFRLTGIKPKVRSEEKTKYSIILPPPLSAYIKRTGVITGQRINKECRFPRIITEETPLPILREFLGGLFGGDGHTICIAHRRDTYYMKSLAFSWSRSEEHIDSLKSTFDLLKILLLKFGIESTIQAPKKTTYSKRKDNCSNAHEIVLNINSECTVQFAEKIGFRYCENKSLKLAIGSSYRRLRDNVLRQRALICKRAVELGGFTSKKKALEQAISEFKTQEVILDQNAIPSQKTVRRILTESSNNELRSETFPTVDEYFKDIGVLDMFLNQESKKVTFALPPNNDFIPVYYLKVIDIREKYKGATTSMCDITVEKGIESYVTNGVVSHNCMLGQGAPHMVNDRLFHQSDAHQMVVCSVCGIQAIDNGTTVECRLCGNSECVLVDIPYGTKLMSDEFEVMNFVPRIITLPVAK